MQVKAIRSAGWQLAINRFVEISMEGDKMIFGAIFVPNLSGGTVEEPVVHGVVVVAVIGEMKR